MLKILEKRKRWDYFREKKKKVIEEYINVKRKQKFINMILKLYFLRNILMDHLKFHVETINEIRRKHFRAWILVFKVKLVIKHSLRKYGPTTFLRHRKNIKHKLTLF